MRNLFLSLPLFAVLASCGEGVSGPSAPPPAAAPRAPRQLTGIEPFAPRTEIRVGQRVGPLLAYGNYDDGTTGAVTVVWTSSNPQVVAVDAQGFAEGFAAGTATLTAASGGFRETLDFVVEDPNPRSERDRPDDVGGPQIHFVYAVPSDIEDRNRDRFGEIERSVAAIQGWLAAKAGKTLRVDTYQGRPDVSFLRLSFTHQEGDGTAGATVSSLLQEAWGKLQIAGDKILAFYYEGSVAGVCGSAQWPGRAGAVYVGRCSDAEVGAAEDVASTYEVVMVHEIFHTFGAVPDCAPNRSPTGGHVDDPNDDVMFAGADKQPRGGETFVDTGRDDYFGHGRSDCLDVARSRFLKPASGLAASSRSVEVRIPVGDWPLRCAVES